MRTPTLLLAAALLASAATAEDDVEIVPRGEELLASLNCTSCHAASEGTLARLQPYGAPRLEAAGARLSPGWMRAFLDDPQGTAPGARMPDLLANLPEPDRDDALDSLVHYLASRGGPQATTSAGVSHPHQLEVGRMLFHEVGCVACHQPQEEARHLEVPWYEVDEWEWPAPPDEDPWVEAGVLDPPAVALSGLAEKHTVDTLSAFLLDPVAVRPSGRMPSLSLTDSEARAIALYLLRDQAFGTEREMAPEPGLSYAYYEADMGPPMPDFEAMTAVRQENWDRMDTLPDHRGNEFGFAFWGWVEVPAEGAWTFYTNSDDGSQLWIGGELVVDNAGDHGMTERSGTLELPAGRHALRVAMYENGGGEGLRVNWEGPGVEKQVIPGDVLSHQAFSFGLREEPFEVDPERVERGEEWFLKLGCYRCHAPEMPAMRSMPALADLGTAAGSSCLSPEADPAVPRYALSDEDAGAIGAALADADGLAAPLEDAAHLRRSMARMNCFVCHRRDGLGGVHPDRLDYFATYDDVELGDQGRIPPHLGEPGAKLRPDWMRAVATEGASLRPYMATRMPQFGADNIEPILAMFERMDPSPDALPEPVFDALDVENGRVLAGTKGLGCIQCHTFNGYDSLGVPAVDLASVHGTLQYDWFRKLLMDPVSVDMNTRMPNFWGEGAAPIESVHGGDPGRQVEALWTYLSLGTSMPIPEGLIVPDAAFELGVAHGVRMVGVFMKGVSPRTVCVGFPENVHYAFDVQNSRLARLWRGRFFNARGTWEGRAGALQSPPSDEVIDLPEGIPFGPRHAEWPEGDGRAEGYRPLGRRFDAEGRPSWRYAFDGVEVTESVEPFLRPGGAGLIRRFVLHADRDPGNLAFRAADETVTWSDRGTFTTGAGVTLSFPQADGRIMTAKEFAPDSPEDPLYTNVLVPLRFSPLPGGGVEATLEVQYTW